jgi:hypothetical protein
METDYPAAHSMDAMWFAVDAAGHVGVFDSGEDGHVPEGASDDYDLIVEIWNLRHPRKKGALDIEQLAGEFGIFMYSYANLDDSIVQIAPYRRTINPENPLHLDQLPPALRQQARQFRFDKFDFVQSQLVQPLEEFPCVFWYEEGSVAYLCSDGKTVRPIPGKEDQFAEFCKQFRKEYPKEAKQYIFEEPQQKTRKPRKRHLKENDDGN